MQRFNTLDSKRHRLGSNFVWRILYYRFIVMMKKWYIVWREKVICFVGFHTCNMRAVIVLRLKYEEVGPYKSLKRHASITPFDICLWSIACCNVNHFKPHIFIKTPTTHFSPYVAIYVPSSFLATQQNRFGIVGDFSFFYIWKTQKIVLPFTRMEWMRKLAWAYTYIRPI